MRSALSNDHAGYVLKPFVKASSGITRSRHDRCRNLGRCAAQLPNHDPASNFAGHFPVKQIGKSSCAERESALQSRRVSRRRHRGVHLRPLQHRPDFQRRMQQLSDTKAAAPGSDPGRGRPTGRGPIAADPTSRHSIAEASSPRSFSVAARERGSVNSGSFPLVSARFARVEYEFVSGQGE